MSMQKPMGHCNGIEWELERAAFEYAVGYIESVTGDSLPAFLRHLRNPDIQGESFDLSMDAKVWAAEEELEGFGGKESFAKQLASGKEDLSGLIANYAGNWITHRAEAMCWTLVVEIEVLLGNHHADAYRVESTNPFGGLVHVREAFQGYGTLFIYKDVGGEKGYRYVAHFREPGIYLVRQEASKS